MDVNEQILEELKAIRRLLTIFSQDKLDEFNEKIKTRNLKTESRHLFFMNVIVCLAVSFGLWVAALKGFLPVSANDINHFGFKNILFHPCR